jgi:hypothetical protein
MEIHDIGLPPEVSRSTLNAFLRLYQLETWMREMAYLELKAFYGTDWWEFVKGLDRPAVPVHFAEKYRTKDKQHPHTSTPENDPLWFISLDTLLKIMLHPKIWGRFQTYFTTRKILQIKFEEIAQIRNRVAHCRSLHQYDVRRVEQLMLDLDHGFWRFCTSYSDSYHFTEKLADNPLAKHLAQAQRRGDHLEVDLYYTIRPSLKLRRRLRPQLGAGIVYDVRIGSKHPLNRFFDYDQILKTTRAVHGSVLHIILDSFQTGFRITIPGTTQSDRVIEVFEKFSYACRNNYSVRPLVPIDHGIAENVDPVGETVNRKEPIQLIAEKWPHYVISPAHPYSFLDGGCPCSFFGID